MTRLIRLIIITSISLAGLISFGKRAKAQWTTTPVAGPPPLPSIMPNPLPPTSPPLPPLSQGWAPLQTIPNGAFTPSPPFPLWPPQAANPAPTFNWRIGPSLGPTPDLLGIAPSSATGSPWSWYVNSTLLPSSAASYPSVSYPPTTSYPSIFGYQPTMSAYPPPPSSAYPGGSSPYPGTTQGGFSPTGFFSSLGPVAPWPSPYPSYPASPGSYPGPGFYPGGYYNLDLVASQQQAINPSGDPNQNAYTSTSSASNQTEPPAQVDGVWIGTWTASFHSSQQSQTSNAASINLAQTGRSVSGVFLFVGHSTINALSATGLIEGNQVQMSAVSSQDGSKLTIFFEGEVRGDTCRGEYMIINQNSGAATEAGEFVVSRIW
ncbi:MAG: hypothetical protein K6U11_06230 [bacterium]|nr:hypothetical protein [bacterium]